MTLERSHEEYKDIRKNRAERQEEILSNIFGSPIKKLTSTEALRNLGEEAREVSDGNGRRFLIKVVETNGQPEFMATALAKHDLSSEPIETGWSMFLTPLDQQYTSDIQVRVHRKDHDPSTDSFTDLDMAAEWLGWDDFKDKSIEQAAEKAKDILEEAA